MVNKAILLGRLGGDPEVRYLQNGDAVTSFRLATSEKRQDKEYVEWHRVVSFGKLAEICGNYLTKGSLVYIEGRIQTRSWDDKDGTKRYSTEIIANQMKMLGGTKKAQSDASEPSQYDDDIPF